MPQIWLTYDELATLMDCNREKARDAVAAIPLDRRKSRDGKTRIKLTPSLTEAFLDAALQQRLEENIATCGSDLRAAHKRMSERSAAVPALRAALDMDADKISRSALTR